MKNKLYFILFGLSALCALLVQFVHSPDIVGFFSYFTIMSNTCAAGIFLYIGLKKKNEFSVGLEKFFGATVVYMSITGLGYWFLLRNVIYPEMIPWVNIVLHAIMPIAVLVGWFVYEHKHVLNSKLASLWLIFPFIYLVYSLVRGVWTNWYPYPFFDPRLPSGYAGVFVYVVCFTLSFYIVGKIIIWSGNKLKG